jgi:RNA polymerase sigma factor (sigma-70 family)
METTPDSHPSDRLRDLLARWQELGDHEALDELLRSEIAVLKGRIRAQSTRLEPDLSVSDVAQEAVLRLLKVEQAPSFESPFALRAYLWKAAWHLLAERLRRTRAEYRTLDESVSQALGDEFVTTGGLSNVEARDRSIALDLVMQLLEPDEQQILHLVYARGLGHEGAARQLGITRDAAKMRCQRARLRLAHKLRHWSELIG